METADLLDSYDPSKLWRLHSRDSGESLPHERCVLDS